MSLIKCSECKKEISDKATKCPNCGCPVVSNNIRNKKKYNNIGLIIGGIITLIILLFLFVLGNIVNLDIELILYALLGIVCLYLSILFFVLWKRKSSKKKINIFIIISTISFLVFDFCCLIYIMNWSSITNSSNDTNIGNERDSSIAQIEIITEYINIRSNKNVNSTIIGQVHYGEIYTIISEDEKSSYNWYEIETSNGIRGYIAGKSKDIDYVKKLETNGSISSEKESDLTKDDRTPYEKFNDTLLSNGYTTSNNSYYIYNFGTKTNEMYKSVDLNKQLYLEYSYYSGLYMLTEYYYGSNTAKFTYKYLGYYGNIEWNLTTTKWTCNSSINNWCRDNGQEYVDKNLNDIINSFNELLNKANVSLDEIK